MSNTHTFLNALTTATLNQIHQCLLEDIVDGTEIKRSQKTMAHITAILNRRQSPSDSNTLPTLRRLMEVAA